MTEFDIPKSYVFKIENIATRACPENFYALKLTSVMKNGKLIGIKPNYIATRQEIEVMKEELNQKVNEYLSLVNDNMSDLEKAIILHDKLVLNCDYSEINEKTAYTTLVGGKGTCQGYCISYEYLMTKLGIDCEFVESTELNHAWLKIKIDGEWYNIDLIWDDPAPDRQVYVSHEYFLLSDEAMSKSHYGEIEQTHKATSKKFDNSIIHDIDTKFCYTDSGCYVMYNNVYSQYTEKYYQKLLRINALTGDCDVVKEFNYKWPTEDLKYFWYGNFTSLDVYENILYYNSPSEIFIYDPAIDYTAVLPNIDEDNHLYGLIINQGVLSDGIGTNPMLPLTINNCGKCDEKPFSIGKTQNMVFSKSDRRVITFGDCEEDNVVNIADATLIQKEITELTSFDKYQNMAADANFDGDVNILDCTAIQKYIVQLD